MAPRSKTALNCGGFQHDDADDEHKITVTAKRTGSMTNRQPRKRQRITGAGTGSMQSTPSVTQVEASEATREQQGNLQTSVGDLDDKQLKQKEIMVQDDFDSETEERKHQLKVKMGSASNAKSTKPQLEAGEGDDSALLERRSATPQPRSRGRTNQTPGSQSSQRLIKRAVGMAAAN